MTYIFVVYEKVCAVDFPKQDWFQITSRNTNKLLLAPDNIRLELFLRHDALLIRQLRPDFSIPRPSRAQIRVMQTKHERISETILQKVPHPSSYFMYGCISSYRSSFRYRFAASGFSFVIRPSPRIHPRMIDAEKNRCRDEYVFMAALKRQPRDKESFQELTLALFRWKSRNAALLTLLTVVAWRLCKFR